MKRLVVLVILLLGVAFYVVWPAYTALAIRDALEARDPAALESKLDLAGIKDSLRPAATAEANRVIDEKLASGGSAVGILGAEIARKAMPKLVDLSLDAFVTPANIVRIFADGGDVRQAVNRMLGNQLSQAGGIPGLGSLQAAGAKSSAATSEAPQPAAGAGGATGNSAVRTVGETPAAAEAAKSSRYGFANIKSIRPAGPFAFDLGVARDPAATQEDLTLGLSFTGLDWKLSAIRPRT